MPTFVSGIIDDLVSSFITRTRYRNTNHSAANFGSFGTKLNADSFVVFWVVTPCSILCCYQCFRGTYRFNFLD